MNSEDLLEYYVDMKKKLERRGFEVEPFKAINYGIQFRVTMDKREALMRVYSGKRGVRIDLSQVKDEGILEKVKDCIYGCHDGSNKSLTASLNGDPEKLIGTDESGKGDYFGPLVVAGVYADDVTSPVLRAFGVDDSKKLSDKQIRAMAPRIKELCPHSIVMFENEKYNELYLESNNLNKILASGHARAIEDILMSVDCPNALSDQFGDPSLIQNALMERGREISLSQRPRAEENVAVAAASVLARYEFISKMDDIEEHYKVQFPKGASSMVIDAGVNFVMQYGVDELKKVAKLHFKTTDDIKSTCRDRFEG